MEWTLQTVNVTIADKTDQFRNVSKALSNNEHFEF